MSDDAREEPVVERDAPATPDERALFVAALQEKFERVAEAAQKARAEVHRAYLGADPRAVLHYSDQIIDRAIAMEQKSVMLLAVIALWRAAHPDKELDHLFEQMMVPFKPQKKHRALIRP